MASTPSQNRQMASTNGKWRPQMANGVRNRQMASATSINGKWRPQRLSKNGISSSLSENGISRANINLILKKRDALTARKKKNKRLTSQYCAVTSSWLCSRCYTETSGEDYRVTALIFLYAYAKFG
jgi:hypothetical protein